MQCQKLGQKVLDSQMTVVENMSEEFEDQNFDVADTTPSHDEDEDG